MNKFFQIALVTTAIVGVGGLVAVSAQADGRWDRGSRDHGGYHEAFGDRDGGKRGGMMRMFESFDTNADGALTQEEIDTFRTERFAAFDGNGDKALELDEYKALWLDAMHERMVDRFQKLDADGDGKVTDAEFGEPFARMVARADRNGDGKIDKDDRMGRGKHHDDDDDDDREHRRGQGPHHDGDRR